MSDNHSERYAYALYRADQELAGIEAHLDRFTSAWKTILNDEEVKEYAGDSLTEKISMLHNLLHSMEIPALSLEAILAVAIHRAATAEMGENTPTAADLEKMLNDNE